MSNVGIISKMLYAIALLLNVFALFPILAWSKRPHVVFILADDLGYNDIGYNAKLHNSKIKTPNLDKLAIRGVKLENYYVQSVCTPSRSQIMSGRYDIHTGLQHGVVLSGRRNALPLNNIILPEQLRSCGYDTHMVGKWHLGYYKKEFLPQNRGFNSFYGTLNGAVDYYQHVSCNKRLGVCGVDMRDTNGPLNSTWGKYSAFTFTDRAKEVISNRNRSKPLFLYLAFRLVHYPMQAPKRFIEPFKHIKNVRRRIYAGMLAALDEAVANITEHLKKSGIYKNTIIIFSTDNGGHNNYGGNNWPLRGRKWTLWEGGVKGVGFVSGGHLERRKVRSSNFMHISDWFPTVLSATGCPKKPGTQPLDGFDQWRAILQKQPSPRTELLHNIDPLNRKGKKPKIVEGFDVTIQSALRSGPWKLLTGNPGFGKWIVPPESKKSLLLPRSSVNSSKWQILHGPKVPGRNNVKLFNIESDPYETKDLSRFFPQIVTRLLQKLAAYNSTSVPCRYPPLDAKSNPKNNGGYWGPWVT